MDGFFLLAPVQRTYIMWQDTMAETKKATDARVRQLKQAHKQALADIREDNKQQAEEAKTEVGAGGAPLSCQFFRSPFGSMLASQPYRYRARTCMLLDRNALAWQRAAGCGT